MALTKCNECGNVMSERASVCPTCGAPPPVVPLIDQRRVVLILPKLTERAKTAFLYGPTQTLTYQAGHYTVEVKATVMSFKTIEHGEKEYSRLEIQPYGKPTEK